ncbi:hypothetical protein [Pseudoxanthomonas sp. USHLN014]|uniref:hypothetical protein n=1 Tax=Pseudoxanthomonas sp. USHLN014 TaxID=3081297 RepID=UPI00301DF1B9
MQSTTETPEQAEDLATPTVDHQAESRTFIACALLALLGAALAIATGTDNSPGGRIRVALGQAVLS